MAYARTCLFVLLSFVAQSLQQDPIADFCRRWDHQTAQVGSKLYIDGGMVTYNQQSQNYSNNYLLASDLTTPHTGTGFPTQQSNLSKPASIPSVSGGYLWADETNKCFYQFGGDFAKGTTPPDFGIWTYDVILNQWNQTNYVTSYAGFHRVSYGAGTQSDSLGSGFYYGGWVNSQNTPGYSGSASATSGMIRFDYGTGAIKNTTNPDQVGRAEGQMVFLPVSDSGLLIYFGGIEDPSRNGSRLAANMSTIHIYDITSSKWYTQTATGDVPLARHQFCAGMTAANDQSSYNIYLYGGYGFGTPLAFNDVYILSMPSFTWVKAYPLPGGDPIPYPDPAGHGACSANVVNNNQMLVIGGWFPNSTHVDCDSPETQGQHNMILGNNTAKNFMWDQYDPKLSSYAVPTAVISAIGGGPTGGATVTAPSTWGHPDLQNYYKIRPSFTARTATRVLPKNTSPASHGSESKKASVGAIAGGVIGGLAALIAVLGLILFCLHRRKTENKEKPLVPRTPTPPVELASTSLPYELSNDSTPGKYNHELEERAFKDNAHDAGAIALAPLSTNHDYISPQHPVPPSYGSASPTRTMHTGTYQSSNQDAYSLQASGHQNGVDQYYPTYTSTHGNPPAGRTLNTSAPHSPHSSHSPHSPNSLLPPGAHQNGYSYPTPTSPVDQMNFPRPRQPQVYYPPPSEPRTQPSPPSFMDQRGSPNGTHISNESHYGYSPPPATSSTVNTPAQFYAQPVAGQHTRGYSSEQDYSSHV